MITEKYTLQINNFNITMKNVLICDTVHSLLPEGLEARGIPYKYKPEISLDETREIVGEFEVIVVNTKTRIDAHFLENSGRLKKIIRLGSGLDTIDVLLAHAKGISVFSTPEGNANAVGEHTLSLLLNLLNHIGPAHRNVVSGGWEREVFRGNELDGKTVGIIGFGHTGPAFAKKLRGFDVEILVYDKYRQHFGAQFRYLSEVSLIDIQTKSDVVSLHIPLTTENRYFINADFFDKCRKPLYFINTSRGKVVNTMDLIQNVESGKLSGVGLDVLENEKPETYDQLEKAMYQKLFSFDNVILTPHIAGWTLESREKIAKQVLGLILNDF